LEDTGKGVRVSFVNPDDEEGFRLGCCDGVNMSGEEDFPDGFCTW
jgi:hypothetical protein